MNYLLHLYIYLIPQAFGWLLLDFEKWFYPYVANVRYIFPCIRLIRGALCDKERTSQQLGGALLQDRQLFMVVTHSIYINTKIYFIFLYVMLLFHIFQYHVYLLNEVDRWCYSSCYSSNVRSHNSCITIITHEIIVCS